MATLSPDEIACAIIVSYKHFEVPALEYVKYSGRAKYYALKILMHYCDDWGVQVSARTLAGYVGYPKTSAHVMGTPSMQHKFAFNKKLFAELYREFEEKLQNIARLQRLKPSLPNTTNITNIPSHTTNTQKPELFAKVQPSNNNLSLDSTVEDVAHYVSANDFATGLGKRKSLEDELRRAIINTGGRLSDK